MPKINVVPFGTRKYDISSGTSTEGVYGMCGSRNKKTAMSLAVCMYDKGSPPHTACTRSWHVPVVRLAFLVITILSRLDL